MGKDWIERVFLKNLQACNLVEPLFFPVNRFISRCMLLQSLLVLLLIFNALNIFKQRAHVCQRTLWSSWFLLFWLQRFALLQSLCLSYGFFVFFRSFFKQALRYKSLLLVKTLTLTSWKYLATVEQASRLINLSLSHQLRALVSYRVWFQQFNRASLLRL